jgi:hypothetical protein
VDAAPEAASVRAGTPIAVWALYVLGLFAAALCAVSGAFVALAYFTTDGGGFGLDISLPALVVWTGLLVAAGGTWIWRRVRVGT